MKSYLVKSCQNGVQRRSHRKLLPATRSTYTFNKAHCVKGHRAGRLFNHNNKMINKKFQNENRSSNLNEEQLISQALAEQPKIIKQVEENAQKGLAELDLVADGDYKNMKKAYYERQLKNPKYHANIIIAQQHPSVAKKISERRIKRNEFLRNPENKICYVCGAKGHVSKECKSVRKIEARQKRTINYKRHLGEKGLYKVDVDAAYRKIQQTLDNVKLENARLISQNIDLKHELDTLTSKLHQEKMKVKDTSLAQECEKLMTANPGPLVKANHVEYQVTGCFKESDKRSSAMNGKSNCRYGLAQRTAVVTGLCAAMLSIVLMLVFIISGSTPIYSDDKTNNYSTKTMTQTHNTNETTQQQSWLNMNVVISVIKIITYIPTRLTGFRLCFIGLVILLIRLLFKLMNRKINGMLEWDAMEKYRTTLKQEGYTSRLPYKVSQLGTSQCPGTKVDAYKLCYTAVIRAATPVTVVCMYAKAFLFVTKNVLGKIEFIYKYSRGWFKRIARIIARVVKFVVCFMLGVLAMVLFAIIKILQILARTVIIITLNRVFASLVLVALIVYLTRVYVVVHLYNKFLQFSGIYEVLRAKLAHYAGMMTFNPIRLVRLIIAKCLPITVHDIIDILVKTYRHLFKYK